MFVQKNSYAMRISRETALAFGLVDPTPQETADMQAWSAEWRVREAQRQQHLADAWSRLLALDPVTVAMCELHRPRGDLYLTCDQCTGYDGDHADWPCETVEVLARHHGIEITEEQR